jgi:hypothetical protein
MKLVRLPHSSTFPFKRSRHCPADIPRSTRHRIESRHSASPIYPRSTHPCLMRMQTVTWIFQLPYRNNMWSKTTKPILPTYSSRAATHFSRVSHGTCRPLYPLRSVPTHNHRLPSLPRLLPQDLVQMGCIMIKGTPPTYPGKLPCLTWTRMVLPMESIMPPQPAAKVDMR